jgi:hypothetical protein
MQVRDLECDIINAYFKRCVAEGKNYDQAISHDIMLRCAQRDGKVSLTCDRLDNETIYKHRLWRYDDRIFEFLHGYICSTQFSHLLNGSWEDDAGRLITLDGKVIVFRGMMMWMRWYVMHQQQTLNLIRMERSARDELYSLRRETKQQQQQITGLKRKQWEQEQVQQQQADVAARFQDIFDGLVDPDMEYSIEEIWEYCGLDVLTSQAKPDVAPFDDKDVDGWVDMLLAEQ